MDVNARRIKPEFLDSKHGYHCERLIDLEQIHGRQIPADFFDEFLNRAYRCQGEFARMNGVGRVPDYFR